MDLNKHIVTNNSNKPFHSSGFAEVANANHIGSTANISYEQRRQIDRNRQVIQDYQRSAIGKSYGVQRAKPAPIRVIRRSVSRGPSLQQHNSLGLVQRHFNEPKSRPYNPFS